MSNLIHPTALVGKNVEMGRGNEIGPHVILEDGVRIGNGNKFLAGAYLAAGTQVGDENRIHMRAVIGHEPQDVSFTGEPSFTTLGNKNVIREFVTIHRGTKPGSFTRIGDNNYLMAYSHVAHNCQLANNIIMVNQASLTGHCLVEDGVILSGMTGFHQFSRIGRLALVSALSASNKDIPPFMIAGGRPAVALGINVVGMRRAKISAATRDEIKQAYKLLYRSGLNVSQALESIRKSFHSPEVKHLVEFIEASKRGILDGTAQETLNPRKSGFLDLPQDED